MLRAGAGGTEKRGLFASQSGRSGQIVGRFSPRVANSSPYQDANCTLPAKRAVRSPALVGCAGQHVLR